ncbi:hypothetical protein RJ640_029664 [Escallonia rubra]|uniref:Chlororespiratory reduction 21 n=1 Tax=Escallonia rubra TaxID=112253 RepID=A0AA88U0U7_9ASTE|nr:hypothetical protein RJ640_029664 [Escallonia rubra]
MASLPVTTRINPSIPYSKHPTLTLPLKLTPTHLPKIQESEQLCQNPYNSYFKPISSLCKNGQIQEAVELFTYMESRNLPTGPYIYGELLQGCVYERDLFTGQQIHSRIIKNGQILTQNEFLQTKLVIFYAKCDLLEVAVHLFYRLSEKSLFSWAAIIGMYCRNGFNQEALLGFFELQENGFRADNFVIPNVLKACAALNLIEFGKGVHGYGLKMGFGECVFVASSLVDMYGKCGGLESARQVFDDMPERNVVAWNSMMVGYVQNGMNEEAIRVFYDMRVEGVEPTRVTLVSFLSASANLCVLEEGIQGHAIAILSGFDLDDILGSSLINFYSNVGLIKDAELVFSRMLEKDVVTWNLLLSSYAQHGQVRNALNLCRAMRLEEFRFDSVTLTSVLSASAAIKHIKLGREAHCYCVRNNLMCDVVVASSVVDMYAKCQRIDDARRVFESATKKDLVLWNTILAAYADLGLSGETLKLFYQMQLEGVPPSVISWNSVIQGFLRNGQVNEATDIFAEMQSLGIKPNLITHTTLITGLAQNGFCNEAIMLFQQMLEAGIQPNIVSMVGVLSACTETASLRYGRVIHGYIVRHDICLSISLATSLLHMYAKCGNLDQAEKLFNINLTKELPLVNAMMSGYALNGCALEALALFKHLQEEGLKPDSITFTTVLSSCNHAGLVKEGLEIFVDMLSSYQVTPSMEHYGCAVSLLSRSGKFHEALQLILSMPFEPDAHIIGSLFAACRDHNEIELGESLVKFLIDAEPDNSGNYVALSNAYASSGRWDKMSQLRNLMKEKGLRKLPGCSWTQIGTEFSVFVAADRNHAQSEAIYAMLALLGVEMRYVGYAPVATNAEI